MWISMKTAGLTWGFHEVLVPTLDSILSKCCHLAWFQHAVVTKLLRPLVKCWQSMGLCCVVYIDDGICAAKSNLNAMLLKIILSDLDSAGFVLSISKCMLDPVQRGNSLGFTLDLRAGSLYVPGEKVSRLQSTIASLNLDRVCMYVHFSVS